MSDSRLPKCPGCSAELQSDPQAGETVYCSCGVVSMRMNGDGMQMLEDRRKHGSDRTKPER